MRFDYQIGITNFESKFKIVQYQKFRVPFMYRTVTAFDMKMTCK